MASRGEQSQLFDFTKMYMKTNELEEVVQQLVSPEVIEPAKTFLRNVEAVFGMLALPLFFYAEGTGKALWLICYVRARTLVGASLGDSESESIRDQIFAESWRLYEEERKKEGRNNALQEETWTFVRESERIEGVRNSLRSLLLVATAAGWTAFETLVTDLWVGVLNAHPIPVAQRAIGALSGPNEEGSLTRKHISVGLVAKHSFDLREVMGDLLKRKFDFTTLLGIREAYNAAFGNSEDLERTLDDQGLKELEWSRHVIVHRGGLVDAEYLRRTSSRLKVGEQLELDGIAVSRFVNAATVAGCGILRFIDGRFQK